MKRFKIFCMAAVVSAVVLSNVLFYQTAKAAWKSQNISTEVSNPYAIATQGNYVYVADYDNGTVIRMELSGANISGLCALNTVSNASGIAVDDSNIYFSDEEFGFIWTMDLDGSYCGTLSMPVEYPSLRGLAVDGSYLYLADAGDNQIVRLDKDGTNGVPLITGLKNPYDVAIRGGYIYVTDTGNNRIIRTDMSGGGLTKLIDGLNNPRGIDVDGSGYIYFADNGNDAVKRMNADGSNLVTIYTVDSPTGVAVGADGSIYVTSNGAESTHVTKLYYQEDDTVAPTVSSVSVPANGTYKFGDTLNFTVNFSEAVNVNGGTPNIALTLGTETVYATYVGGTGTTALTFSCTIPSLSDSDGITVDALTANGATLRDAAGNDADLTLNSVGATSGVLIDAIRPVVTSVAVPSSGSYKVWDTLDFTVNFSKSVIVNGIDTVLGITVGGTPRSAVYQSKTGTSITYSYTVQSGDADSDGITVGSIVLNSTTVKDSAGNYAVMTLNNVGVTTGVIVDTTVPTVTSVTVPSSGSYKAGDTLNFTVNFSKAVTVTGTDTVLGITVGDTSRSAAFESKTGTSITYRYTVQYGDNDSDGITIGIITLNTSTVKDAMDNDAVMTLNNVGATTGVKVDTTAPTVTSVAVPANGTYKAGDNLDFTVDFDEAVTVTGTDTVLGITVGNTSRSAAYQSKTATSITYRYTVQEGDTDNDGITVGSIVLNSTTVKDAATNDADMTLNSVGATTGVLIDGIRPVVTSVAVPSSGSYMAGDTLVFTVNFSKTVTVTGMDTVLGITVGGTSRSAVYQSKMATSITYRYTVQSGDTDSDGITIGSIVLNTTTVKDSVGNNAVMTLNNVGVTTGVKVDTTVPTVTSVTVPSFGCYKAGDTLDFTVNFDEAVTMTGTDTVLGITVGGTSRSAAYESKTGTSITYRYMIQDGDNDNDGITIGIITLNTTTVKDAVGNDAVMTLNNVGATTGVKVDTTAPTVTSVTVPSFGSYKAGDNLDFTVDFDEAVTVTGTDTVLSITVGGTSRSAAYQSKTATSITYRYTVQEGDTDSDGITVGSIVLNSTTVKDVATNDADMTLNSVGVTTGVLIDAIRPVVTSVTVPSSGSYKAGDTLDFTVDFSKAVTVNGTDTVLGITVGGTLRSAVYQSKTATSITYRYIVQLGDDDSDGITVGSIVLNSTTVKDTVGNNAVMTLNNVGVTIGVIVDTTVPTVTAVTTPSSGSYKFGDSLDFTVNFSEAVTLTGTDTVLGITVGGMSRSAAFESKTGTSIAYRYTVQDGDNDSDGITVGIVTLNTSTVKDAVGNDAVMTLNNVGATTGVKVDTIAPAPVTNITLSDNDTTTGINGRDFSVSFTDLVDESDVEAYRIYLYKDSQQPNNKLTMDALPSGSKIAVKTIAPTAAHDGAPAYLGSNVTTDSKGQSLVSGDYWVIVCTVDHAGNYDFAITGTKASISMDAIPSTGGGGYPGIPSNTAGTLEKDLQQKDGAPAAIINNDRDTLKAGVLTAEEQARVAAGENAKLTLTIEDISKTVSDEDKKIVEEKLSKVVQNAEQQNTETTVLYVDISLFKQVGNGDETRVTQTDNKISISIEIPQELRNNNGEYSRTYHIVRIHDNEAELLDGIYDPATHLFTFETDRFSVYALTYQDTKNTGSAITVFKDFRHLRLTAKATATTQKLSYVKVSGADGYLIYGAKCGNDMTELADVADTVTSYTVKNLKKATFYKYQVKAYKIINGEQVIIAISNTVHTVTTSKAYGNPIKITTEASSITLKAGKTKLLVCELVLPEGKKLKKHTSEIRYESANKEIATISSSGKITAKAKGVCYVYAYAQNGVYIKTKITVK